MGVIRRIFGERHEDGFVAVPRALPADTEAGRDEAEDPASLVRRMDPFSFPSSVAGALDITSLADAGRRTIAYQRKHRALSGDLGAAGQWVSMQGGRPGRDPLLDIMRGPASGDRYREGL